MNPTILHIIDTSADGGAENLLVDLIRNSLPFFRVEVIVLGKKGRFSNDIESLGVKIFHYKKNSWSLITPTLKLINQIRKSRPAIVHTHLDKSHLLGWLAIKFVKHPTKLFRHDHSDMSLRSLNARKTLPKYLRRIYLYIYNVSLIDCMKIFVLSSEQQKYYLNELHLRPSQVVVMHNYLSKKRLADIQNASSTACSNAETINIAMIGRMSEVKNWRLFLEVAFEVQKLDSSVKFFAIGNGLEMEYLQNFAKKLGVSNVTFLGHRSDIPELLAKIDILLHTSNSESFGLVYLEAIAAKCTVITTATNGAMEIFHDQQTALICPIGGKECLVLRLMLLIKNTNLRKDLTQNAYVLLEKFTEENASKILLASYIEAVGNKQYLHLNTNKLAPNSL